MKCGSGAEKVVDKQHGLIFENLRNRAEDALEQFSPLLQIEYGFEFVCLADFDQSIRAV